MNIRSDPYISFVVLSILSISNSVDALGYGYGILHILTRTIMALPTICRPYSYQLFCILGSLLQPWSVL